MKPNILVAIPCYNCEKQINRVISEFDSSLLKRVSQVMIIDNQSKDNTIKSALQIVKKLNYSKFVVVKNDNNYNLGGSHKVAFVHAQKNNFSHIAILHGDNQAKTQELNLLLDELEKNSQVDAVLGARFMKGSTLQGYSPGRILGNEALNLLFTLITLHKTVDLGSGLNIFAMKALPKKDFIGFDNGLTFNIDLLLYLFRHKKQISYIPITWREEDQVSNAKAIDVGLKALKTLLAWRFNTTKKIPSQPYTFTIQK